MKLKGRIIKIQAPIFISFCWYKNNISLYLKVIGGLAYYMYNLLVQS